MRPIFTSLYVMTLRYVVRVSHWGEAQVNYRIIVSYHKSGNLIVLARASEKKYLQLWIFMREEFVKDCDGLDNF